MHFAERVGQDVTAATVLRLGGGQAFDGSSKSVAVVFGFLKQVVAVFLFGREQAGRPRDFFGQLLGVGFALPAFVQLLDVAAVGGDRKVGCGDAFNDRVLVRPFGEPGGFIGLAFFADRSCLAMASRRNRSFGAEDSVSRAMVFAQPFQAPFGSDQIVSRFPRAMLGLSDLPLRGGKGFGSFALALKGLGGVVAGFDDRLLQRCERFVRAEEARDDFAGDRADTDADRSTPPDLQRGSPRCRRRSNLQPLPQRLASRDE